MNRKLICLISLVFLFTGISAVPSVYAETDKNSRVSIEFEANMGPTQPVDPERPSTSLPGGSSVGGSLTIVYVSNFDFGMGMVSTVRKFYNIDTDNPNIQIVDLRGTGSGWALDASVSAFEGDEGQVALRGSRIHIKNGRLNSDTSMEYAPMVHTEIALPTDNTSVRVMTADEDEGQGLWVNRFYPANTDGEEGVQNEAYVQLEVPAGTASPGAYTATITWTLSNTP